MAGSMKIEDIDVDGAIRETAAEAGESGGAATASAVITITAQPTPVVLIMTRLPASQT